MVLVESYHNDSFCFVSQNLDDSSEESLNKIKDESDQYRSLTGSDSEEQHHLQGKFRASVDLY
jgi:hypothetical protein